MAPPRCCSRSADSGPGISDDDREKIFEPFFTTKPDGKGTAWASRSCATSSTHHRGEDLRRPVRSRRFAAFRRRSSESLSESPSNSRPFGGQKGCAAESILVVWVGHEAKKFLLELLEAAAGPARDQGELRAPATSVVHGGLCRSGGEYRIIVDKRASAEEGGSRPWPPRSPRVISNPCPGQLRARSVARRLRDVLRNARALDAPTTTPRRTAA